MEDKKTQISGISVRSLSDLLGDLSAGKYGPEEAKKLIIERVQRAPDELFRDFRGFHVLVMA